MFGLWVWFPVGHVQEEIDQYFFLTSMFLSLIFSLPSLLSKNKWIKSFLKKEENI